MLIIDRAEIFINKNKILVVAKNNFNKKELSQFNIRGNIIISNGHYYNYKNIIIIKDKNDHIGIKKYIIHKNIPTVLQKFVLGVR